MIGMESRRQFYSHSLAYEDEYFEENPDGDGGIAAGTRHITMAEWWNDTWINMQEERFVQHRINSFRRCGFLIGVDSTSDEGKLCLPDIVRFKGTAFTAFADSLDPQHPEYFNRTSYKFSLKESEATAKVFIIIYYYLLLLLFIIYYSLNLLLFIIEACCGY